MKKISLFLLIGIVFLASCVVKKIKVYEENQAIKFLDETQKYTSTTRDDYVLTGGEIPACAIIDSIARLVPGVISDESIVGESFTMGLLEYPQYTRPYEFHGIKVPDVLISGHHANIDRWRAEKAAEMTAKMRPDLLDGKED